MMNQTEQRAAWAAAVAARDAAQAATTGTTVAAALVCKVPTGVIDGVNRVYTFPGVPTLVARNGLLLHVGDDYVQTGVVVTLSSPLSVGDTLVGY